jgi:Zn-dependent M28 family amino/carboxypeptidase
VSTVNLGNQELLAALRALPDGETPATITAKLPAATEEPVKLKNVIAVLRGSDPLLKDTYVLVTAHYDHIGLSRSQAADNINNGANDDASGVACMLELAAAFSGLAERPRRSIVFMAYFGEERGLLGSRYYTRNPVFPLAKTVANLNLEHMGRTDDTEGSTEGKLTATGFDYSSVVEVLQQAGEAVGLKVYKHDTNSDSFFGRSDNQALADAGVPAHTILACYIFPDYHRPGDHWDKLDYDNMAQLNRAAGLATLRLANSATAPRWNEANPKAAKYLEAWKQLQSNH